MRRTLLVAEGTLDRPLVNVATTAAGFSVTLLLGFGILHLGLPGWVTLLALAALLIGVAWLKGRYGAPRSFRVEKPAVGGALRITGRFDNGELPHNAPAELLHARREGDSLLFLTRHADSERTFHIRKPAFSQPAMDALQTLMDEMPEATPDALETRYKKGHNGIKAYDARKLLLLRFTQKPGHVPVTLVIVSVTLLFWLAVLAVAAPA
ncbi:hypothetical protein [Aquisalimonas asiatica]|uniref:Uncharacterized protein n=1 Tax=Aquisalimonas asiatica TaxID=406100 RepID=A0A1H8PUC6_9GAMM|nr:hypothetical protein [Aquisalimonas asiatica]SEO45338.1 hypothetical protein SAMN04488052_101154 [Aquisalimonas asiatica]